MYETTKLLILALLQEAMLTMSYALKCIQSRKVQRNTIVVIYIVWKVKAFSVRGCVTARTLATVSGKV